MNIGDKAVVLGCALMAAGWCGYELRQSELVQERLVCSPRLDDGRPLINSYAQANGRLLCTYADPMPAYHGKEKHSWT